MYQIISQFKAKHTPSGTVFTLPPAESHGFDYERWIGEGNTPEPAPITPIADRRAAVWEQIKAARELRRQSGVTASGRWFHSNDTSRIQQIGLVMMGANIPPGLLWRTMDNGEVPMTQALAGSIFQAVAASDAAHFESAKVHRAAMEAAPDPDAYSFSTGWPAIFEG